MGEPTSPKPRDTVALDLDSSLLDEAEGLPALARVSEVERLIGASGDRSAHPRLIRQVCHAVEQANALVRPRCAHRILSVAAADERELLLEGGIALRSRKLAEALSESTRAVVFAVTVGEPIETEIRRLSAAGEHFDAHVLDAAASAAVESLAGAFQEEIEARARGHDLGTTRRFSPGYCDWNVTGQRFVFSLLGPRPAGIELLPSCLMKPLKSIAGVFGLLPLDIDGPSSSSASNPCTDCSLNVRCRVRRN